MTDDDRPEIELGPVEQIQSILADLDPSSMVLGFVVVTEWLEDDGTRTMSVIHTDQPPWHLYGVLTYARDSHIGGCVDYDVEDFDEG